MRFYVGIFIADNGSHPFVSIGNGDKLMITSIIGLFAMSVFGGSVFVSFVDGLVTESICLNYQEKLILLETTFLGRLL